MGKKEKKKFENEIKKRLKIPVVGVSDNIVFSKKEVWAYYKISTVPYRFLSAPAKATLAQDTITALAALNQSEGKKQDCHILMTSTPFDMMSWVNQVDKRFGELHPELLDDQRAMEAYYTFMDKQYAELYKGGFQRPVVYLGLKLFTRGSFNMDSLNVLEFGFKDAAKLIKDGISNLFMIPSEQIDPIEEQRAKVAEKALFSTLDTGNLHARRVTANELLLTIKRRFYPAMTVPYLEVDHGHRFGLNDVVMETGGVLENGYRHLKLSQFIDGREQSGYRATLSFASFPKNMAEPSNKRPFLYLPSDMAAPYTMNARFTMIPQQKIKKDLEKKKLEASDEISNLSNSGQGANSTIQGKVTDLSILEDDIANNRMPWVQGSYRVTIESPTVDMLKESIQELKQAYENEEITLAWTAGDQLKLFMEELPGGTLASPSFNQMTNLAMLGASGFNLGGEVGDPIDEKMILTQRGARNEGQQ